MTLICIMNINDRILRSVRARADSVFRPGDFRSFGSEASVKRALTQLVKAGILVRIGMGIYAKAKCSVLSGNPIPICPLEVLAPQALRKLGIYPKESLQTSEYNSGNSTQVPTGITFYVGRQRITRKIGFNGQLVQYERV
jgi:hypothetical protein